MFSNNTEISISETAHLSMDQQDSEVGRLQTPTDQKDSVVVEPQASVSEEHLTEEQLKEIVKEIFASKPSSKQISFRKHPYAGTCSRCRRLTIINYHFGKRDQACRFCTLKSRKGK